MARARARALAVDPVIVLLDEPFSSLDAAMRTEVRADVRRVLVDTATTAVLVTHDQDEALSFADLVAVIRDGRIAQAGPPHEVYDQPADPSMAQFLGEANLVVGVVRGTAGGLVVRTVLGDLEVQGTPAASRTGNGAGVVALIRPEQLELSRPGGIGPDAASGRDPCWAGRVVSIDDHGHDAVVRVAGPAVAAERAAGAPLPGDSGGPDTALELTVRLPGRDRVAIGTAVRVGVHGPVPIWERSATSG